MSIRVLFFASLAEITGTREAAVDAPAGATVGSILALFEAQYPRLGAQRRSTLSSLNSEYAGHDSPVKDGDEIAFFPPVSGG